MLRLTFLGTSSGLPTRWRNVSALAVQAPLAGPGWYLVDCGEGTQQQLLRTPLALRDLAGVCISHVHGDHCLGLPGLLASAGMHGRSQPLMLVAPLPVWQWWQATQQCTGTHLPYPVHFIPVESLRAQPLDLPSASGQAQAHVQTYVQLRLSTYAQRHRVPSHAFRFDLHQQLRQIDAPTLRAAGLPPGPAWGQLQAGQDVWHAGRTLRSADFVRTHTRRLAAVMGGDNAEASVLRAACQGAALLVHEATYSRAALDKVGPAYMHSAAHDVAAFAQSAGLPGLILTHFSARHHSDAQQALLMQEVQAAYQGAAFLARDFDVFTLDFDGALRHIPSGAHA
ncbi:ribonuclease Z [Vandammella animalimorsus]|uniref:Ribonuclease Z n=1 Tax=Vandammella animalimorsus TaxID=2029117 RepID=A0A2A2ADI5_9BURK|nr:ribonuclease Z [Vandammella animalimorsus]PAT35798.1 MBL fold metallo-hydrolase [Vandammella animalimorsus]